MRVLFVPDIVTQYGATESLLGMVEGLKKEHKIIPLFLTPKEGRITEFSKKNGCMAYAVGYSTFFIGGSDAKWKQLVKDMLMPYYYLRHAVGNKRALKIAEQALPWDQIDVIHTNVNRNDIGALLAKKHNIPHIWHLREFGDLDFRCRPVYKDYIKVMNENTTAFVAISRAVAEHWIKKGLDAEKVRVIYNGVGRAWAQEPRHFPEHDPNKLCLVMVGAVCETKGQRQLIEALALLSDEERQLLQVDIIGSGANHYMKQLIKQVQRCGVDDVVTFRGYCQNVPSYLPGYDIGIMCSRSEGFGRVTAEYMMAGLCVIASNTGANPELVEHGKTGLLYQYGDAESLKQCIQKLMYDRVQCEELGRAGKAYAEENFTAEKNAQQIYALYEEILRDAKK